MTRFEELEFTTSMLGQYLSKERFDRCLELMLEEFAETEPTQLSELEEKK